MQDQHMGNAVRCKHAGQTCIAFDKLSGPCAPGSGVYAPHMLLAANWRNDPTCRHNVEQVRLADGHALLEPVPSVEGETLVQAAGAHDAAVAREVHTARRQAIDAEDVAAQGYAPADFIPGGPMVLKFCLSSRSCMFHVEDHCCGMIVAAKAQKLEEVPENKAADGHVLVANCVFAHQTNGTRNFVIGAIFLHDVEFTARICPEGGLGWTNKTVNS